MGDHHLAAERYDAPMTALVARPGAPTRSRHRTGGWVLAAAQYGFTVWYAVCLWLALARAAHFAGRWYVPSQGDAYTGNADIMAGWPWALVVWLTVPAAWMVGLLSLFVSAVVFWSGYPKGHRRLTIALLGGGAAMLLTLAVSMTPAAQSISGWLLD